MFKQDILAYAGRQLVGFVLRCADVVGRIEYEGESNIAEFSV